MPHSYRKTVKKLKRKGSSFLRESEGSYEIWMNKKRQKITVPRHNKDFPTGTFLKIIKAAGFKNIQDFEQF